MITALNPLTLFVFTCSHYGNQHEIIVLAPDNKKAFLMARNESNV